MKIELPTGVLCPRFLFSVRKESSSERGPWLIVGQLYRGYAGLMARFGSFNVTLWIKKCEDNWPHIGTVFLGI